MPTVPQVSEVQAQPKGQSQTLPPLLQSVLTEIIGGKLLLRAQAKQDYRNAFEEMESGQEDLKAPENQHKLSPTSRMLLDTGPTLPFPDKGSEKDNDAWVDKYGYEKAIGVLDARIGKVQERIGKYKARGNAQGDMDASISQDYADRLNKYKDKLLSRQGF